MSEELKACPLCNAAAVEWHRPMSGAWGWIGCPECRLGLSCNSPKDLAEQTRVWNTRAQSQFGTAELLAIANEMERIKYVTTDDQAQELAQLGYMPETWAARIRAVCAPEAVAFFEAAKEVFANRWAPSANVPADIAKADAAYRAMLLAAQEKGK